MSRKDIMVCVNKILMFLEFFDEEFIDRTVSAITYNEPFTDEEIEELYID